MFCKSSLVILALSAAVTAKVSLGVNVSYQTNSRFYETSTTGMSDQEGENHYTDFSITPVLGIYPSDLIEISPFLGWSLSTSESVPSSSSGSPTNKSTSSQHSIEPGCGLYFHLIKNSNILDFSLGPKISYRLYFHPNQESGSTKMEYDTYVNGSASVACQVNIDLHFSERFATRMSSNLYRFGIAHQKTKAKNSTTTNRNINLTNDLRSIFTPALGFYFTF